MKKVLEINHLTKQYGDKKAIDQISFSVKEGSCFGLLGPNGAGKSTTMKIIAGIIESNAGDVHAFGLDVAKEREAMRMQIGYVPQEITLYEQLSARENLLFFGEMYGLRGKELNQRIDQVLQQVGLSDRAKDVVRTFSGGMKRRINIAAALLHQPKLLILDEPTVGIDPQSRNHIFEMIRKLNAAGVTIIYSTHYMEEVETLCDELAIIDHGKVIVQGSLESLLDQYAQSAIYLETESMLNLPELSSTKSVTSEGRGWMIETDHPLDTIGEISERMKQNGVIVKALEITRPSLEKVFLGLTGTSLRD